MRKRMVVRAAVLLLSFGAAVAHAQTAAPTAPAPAAAPAGQWTLDSGQTIGEGANVVRAQVGWPGLWGDFIHGVDPTFDIGGRFGLNWGSYPGATLGGGGIGLTFQLLLRKQFFEIAGYKVAFTFDPGLLLAFPGGTTIVGIMFPIGGQIGFPVAEHWVINASLELPMFIQFGVNGGPSIFFIPILFGGGAEYMIQPNLVATFKLALGPDIATSGGSSFALQALVGIAYKF